jgi:hypothetical protein
VDFLIENLTNFKFYLLFSACRGIDSDLMLEMIAPTEGTRPREQLGLMMILQSKGHDSTRDINNLAQNA